MTTLSVPLTAELEKYVDTLVDAGYGANKADAVRRAIKSAAEQHAIEAIIRASQEPTLSGDLRELAKKII